MSDPFYNDSPHQPTAIPEPFTPLRRLWAGFLAALGIAAAVLAVVLLI